MTQKKLSLFVHHKFFIFIFHIAHWQHVDLLRSGPRNKETFNPSFTHLSDIPKQLLSKSCSGKKVFLLSMFIYVCKTSVKGSYFSKVTDFFRAFFAKINTVTGIFQGFYLELSNFLLYAILPEDFPMAHCVNFKMSFQ